MTPMTQTILHETEGLSWNALQEVLDFIRFLKVKEQRVHCQLLVKDQELHQTLKTGEADSLAHLEEEFAYYKELYPHEI